MEHPHTRISRAMERTKMTVLLLLFKLGEGKGVLATKPQNPVVWVRGWRGWRGCQHPPKEGGDGRAPARVP